MDKTQALHSRDGEYINRDNATPGTVADAADANAIQGELVNLILALGLTPNRERINQLASAFRAMLSEVGNTPPGNLLQASEQGTFNPTTESAYNNADRPGRIITNSGISKRAPARAVYKAYNGRIINPFSFHQNNRPMISVATVAPTIFHTWDEDPRPLLINVTEIDNDTGQYNPIRHFHPVIDHNTFGGNPSNGSYQTICNILEINIMGSRPIPISRFPLSASLVAVGSRYELRLVTNEHNGALGITAIPLEAISEAANG